MEITFLGVGEAFDDGLPNTSILIRTEVQDQEVTFLLDCGYSAPPPFWRLGLDADRLDGIWISHFHADHAFGIPPLMVRFWEEGRRKTLTLFGQKGIEGFVQKALDLAYPNIRPRLGYPLSFVEVEPGEPIFALGCAWGSARNDHPQRDLVLRLEAGGRVLFYSGDGRPTPESKALAHHTDLIIHEAFGIEEGVPGHGSVWGCIDFARSCQGKRLALVHIQRGLRRERLSEIREIAGSVKDLPVLIPEPGDRLMI